jgi:hypothetical protein
MDSFPAEVIDAIGKHLDFHSAVRFSFTCSTAYELAHPYVSKMVAMRKTICREIAEIKYEIRERGEVVREDIYGRYCSIRTYQGRVVGALHCTAYNRLNRVAIEDTTFVSDSISMTGSNRLPSGDDEYQVDVCCFDEAYRWNLTGDDVSNLGYRELYWTDMRGGRACDYVSINVYSPVIVDGKLKWRGQLLIDHLPTLI